MDLTLNNNFYNYVGCLLFGGIYTSQSGAAIGTPYANGFGYWIAGNSTIPCSLTNTSGTSCDAMYYQNANTNIAAFNHTFFAFNSNNSSSVKDIVFVAGSGNTAATINDYALATPNTNISVAIESGKRDTDKSILYTVSFSSASEQTLSEIGLTRMIFAKAGGNTTYQDFLLGRCVLDEPVTLDANTTKTLQVRLALPTLE